MSRSDRDCGHCGTRLYWAMGDTMEEMDEGVEHTTDRCIDALKSQRDDAERRMRILNQEGGHAIAQAVNHGIEQAAELVGNHSCMSSCCGAQPGGDTAEELARCVRKLKVQT